MAITTFRKLRGGLKQRPSLRESLIISPAFTRQHGTAEWTEVPISEFISTYGGGGGASVFTAQTASTTNPSQLIGIAGGTLSKVSWVDIIPPAPGSGATLQVVDAGPTSTIFARRDFTNAELTALPGAGEVVDIPIILSTVPPGTVLGLAFSGTFVGLIQVEFS